VMLLLFFLFPRVQGPLWGMPQDAYSGVTGLSETMSPGSISSLSLSDAIAFRVKFETGPPSRAQLYWRGPVLSDFDGLAWRVGLPQLRRNMSIEATGSPVDYEVTLEPHNRNWMFALEMPARLPPSARLTSEYLVISLTPIRSRIRYEMRSFPKFQAASGANPEDLALALRLPRGVNPRSLALAREWRESLADNSAIVRRAIEFFRGSRFEYTLQPPALGQNSVDEFLFDTKQGFCEHFASSFVFLMRAAGVPARVVTGYQGGDTNPVDGYMVVRQADAHAWAEVWLAENGWTRVDPTAAAVPVRIELGITAARPSGAAPLRDARQRRPRARDPRGPAALLRPRRRAAPGARGGGARHRGALRRSALRPARRHPFGRPHETTDSGIQALRADPIHEMRGHIPSCSPISGLFQIDLKQRLKHFLLAAALALPAASLAAPGYPQRKEVKQFIAEMVHKHRFTRSELNRVFGRAQFQPAIIKAMEQPAETALASWQAYRALFINRERIDAGVQFWNHHAEPLGRA